MNKSLEESLDEILDSLRVRKKHHGVGFNPLAITGKAKAKTALLQIIHSECRKAVELTWDESNRLWNGEYPGSKEAKTVVVKRILATLKLREEK